MDAILGTGFRPPVTGLYAKAIAGVNGLTRPVLAVDIPSGADSDSLSPQSSKEGVVIARADAIVTFTAPRPAHLFGNLTSGPVAVAQIGSPPEVDSVHLESARHHRPRYRSAASASRPRCQQRPFRPRAGDRRLDW